MTDHDVAAFHRRRRFLAGTAALAATGPLAGLAAQAAPLTGADYRALVCVFFYGGNDGNNTVVPTDTAGYAAYAAARRPSNAGGLTLAQDTLVPLSTVNVGLHPGLRPLGDIWTQGNLAIQANVGTLIKPLTKSEYLASAAARPPDLFSHSDQQMQWQQGASGLPIPSGWGGRVADLQGRTRVPSVISVSGNSVFINGATSAGLAVPATGRFIVQGFGATPASNPLYSLYTGLLRTTYSNVEVQAAAGVMSQALDASAILDSALSAPAASAPLFAGQNNSIAQQLLAVTKMIEARQSIGVTRQIFFVSAGGFDTHNDQLSRQGALFNQLGPALKSFYDATVHLGISAQVTTFTASDFARTLQPASGGGSDHAWGNHQFVIGGAVKGNLFGRMPQMILGGPDDVSSEGRWLPTTSVEQMGATLARWLGVTEADLPAVFPHLSNFTNRDLRYFG